MSVRFINTTIKKKTKKLLLFFYFEAYSDMKSITFIAVEMTHHFFLGANY